MAVAAPTEMRADLAHGPTDAVIAVRLPPDLATLVLQYAEAHDVPASRLIRRVIDERLALH